MTQLNDTCALVDWGFPVTTTTHQGTPAFEWSARGVGVAAAATVVGVLGFSPGNSFAISDETWSHGVVPHTVVLWSSDNVATTGFSSIMNFPAVADFLRSNADVSLGALQDIYRLVSAEFGGAVLNYVTEFDDDTDRLILWLDVDTNGMSIDDQFHREQSLHARISQLAAGSKILERHVISVH